MSPAPPAPAGDRPGCVERFPLAATRERWLDLVFLEHETLALPEDFSREGEDLLVFRRAAPSRAIAAGRVPRHAQPALLLQAAAALAFFQPHGLWLDDEDLAAARWDLAAGTPRLWLAGSPAGVGRGGPGPAPSAVLASFLRLLLGRNVRTSELLERLLSSEAPFRRADFWLASAFRSFPDLASARMAPARLRTLGYGGSFLRGAGARARVERGRALLNDRAARIFHCERSRLSPGSALGLDPPPRSVAEGSRRLREREDGRCEKACVIWIAVEPERWDVLSRRAFESAARAMGESVERVELSSVRPPHLPDEWRREVFVPCGTLSASLRFYEALAEAARENPAGAPELARRLVSSEDWAAFVSDPTGSVRLPEPLPGDPLPSAAGLVSRDLETLALLCFFDGPVAEEPLRKASSRRAVSLALARLKALGLAADCGSGRWEATARGKQRNASRAIEGARSDALARRLAEALSDEPLRQVEVLLAAGEVSAANEVARKQIERDADGPPEAWFELSARLAPAAGDRPPPWLDALEAEREAAGGRAAEALRRLERLEADASAPPALRRASSLRAAELCVAAERRADALRRVASWNGLYPDAPSTERLRALRLEASCRSRLGETAQALVLLEEADRIATDAERLETALARADVYSRQGRFEEEGRIYEAWRAAALGAADERLGARFLSREALWLCDRRDFPSAIDRLEQARGMLYDDPVERAKVSIDLASALYHSGRPEECRPLLEEAIWLSAAGGRQDLVRLARGNRVELLVNRTEWDTAEAEIETLLREARREKDEVALLVGLRHRSRLRLRRGLLQESARDNRRALEIAARLGDRLEAGELWLEDGDRLLYEGDLEGARRSWERAAVDPPDRCDSERRGRLRLWELGLREQGGPPPQALALLEELFARDPYEAAETAARWRGLFGATGFPPGEVCRRAAAELRTRGGALLADRVFGGSARSVEVSEESLRRLRREIALVLSGESPAGREALEPFGLSSLAITESGGREIARLGGEAGEDPAFRRTLHAGAATYLLTGSPAVGAEALSAVALLLETLLYRPDAPAAPSDFAEGWRRFGIVTQDGSMEEPYRRLVRFAPQPVTVLVLGESGSGKEAAARAIHLLSTRSAGPFVAVNVSAVPAALLESELFGHVRGAFTGAERDRRGLLEEAERGTIFFDEIGELPSSLQAKLLRVLQEREFRRVGESPARRSDVRVVSATSRDLAREVEAGHFREDLYYRLSVAVLALPPLRERGRDPLLLARHFLDRFGSEFGRGALRLSADAVGAIQAHAWPGNVRELQNAMAQASALAEPDGVITAAQLPDAVRASGKPRSWARTGDYRSRVDAHRRDLIAEALERAGGNRSRAARDLGLSRQALLYLIRELRVSPRSSH